jgi:hypothetical protein
MRQDAEREARGTGLQESASPRLHSMIDFHHHRLVIRRRLRKFGVMLSRPPAFPMPPICKR